jgi:membrane protease YdiL (CAAX protease family)
MPLDELPDDLVAFLESKRDLDYDPTQCEIGVFTFRTLDEVGEIDLAVDAEDHQSNCIIRALDLVKTCEVYDPRGMFVYIPSLRKYGSYDSENRVLITYRGMSWTNFSSDPARYINAAWDYDPDIAEATFSEAGADRLVVVYSAANDVEAHGLRAVLEERGIRAQVVGESLGNAVGRLPFGEATAPRIQVREGDTGRAREIIEDLSRSPVNDRDITFACEECGKNVTFPGQRRGHVEVCPYCNSYLDVPEETADAPLAAPALATSQPVSEGINGSIIPGVGLRTKKWLWIEVLAVLSFAYVPYLFAAVTKITEWLPSRATPPFAYQMLAGIVYSLQIVMPVLMIIGLSGERWQSFGIVYPKWIADAFAGCAIWLAGYVACYFALSLLPPLVLQGMASRRAPDMEGPTTIAGFVVFAVMHSAHAFAEELVMRAYLITRLERLLSSTWRAVAVTTVLFASCHIYQGIAGTISAAASGLVLAIFFCWLRRLWPVCLAHALHNILVICWPRL